MSPYMYSGLGLLASTSIKKIIELTRLKKLSFGGRYYITGAFPPPLFSWSRFYY